MSAGQAGTSRWRHLRPYRVARVASTVVLSLPAYLWLQFRERIGRPADDAAWLRAHERCAARVDRTMTALGGIPTKFAQIAGARGDLFPEPFVRRMRRYHDAVAPRPFDALRAQVERSLGGPLDRFFAEVEPQAIAAASIAQVHRARLRDGRRVVLKIQYPEIARIAALDLATGRAVSRVVALLTGTDLRSFVREITRFVALEVDFAREAASTRRAARELADLGFVRVPAVVDEVSSTQLLVLEYLDGIPIAETDRLRDSGHEPAELARKLARLYASMIFERGFFHGDPHPGNLLVLPGGELALLDFGLCKELAPDFARRAARLIASGFARDGAGVLRAAAELGFDTSAIDADGALALIGMILGRLRPEGSAPLPLFLRANPLKKIPEDVALIVRSLILLNGLSHALAPGQQLVQAELARCLLPLLAAGSAEAAG